MNARSITRRTRALSAVLVLAATAGAAAQELVVSTVPATVFKSDDGGKRRTESWFFSLVVSGEHDRSSLCLLEAKLELCSGDRCVETQILPSTTLERMRRTAYLITKGLPAHDLRHRYGRDELVDLPLEFPQRSVAWGIDRVLVTLRASVAGGKEVTATKEVAVRRYEQRTSLRFPFRGPGIVSQGTIANGGHSGVTNQFAIDVLALTPTRCCATATTTPRSRRGATR